MSPQPAPAGAARRSAVGILGAGRQALESSGYCAEAGLDVAFFVEEQPPDDPRDATAFAASILSFDDIKAKQRAMPVISAVGSPQLRRHLVSRWDGRLFGRLVAQRAWLAEDTVIGAGTTIAPHAALNRMVHVGDHVLVNVGVILSHDVSVGDFATISPGCVIGGWAAIGPGAFLGIGATVMDRVRIGCDAVVAAGAVVIRDVADGDTVVGVPARSLPRR